MTSILFVSHSASLTGAPMLLHDFASRLDKTRYELTFLVGEDGPLVERFRKLGATYVDPIYPDELKYWREIRRIRKRIRFLKSVSPDLVFCNTIHTAKWLVYARMLGIPTITHVLELSQAFATVSLLEHQMLKLFSGQFIAASAAVNKFLVERQGIKGGKVHVLHAGIDVERFGKRKDVEELKSRLGLADQIVIGTVGRIAYVKGSDLFLQLALRLKQLFSFTRKLKFLVVATTADKEFVAKFNELLRQYDLQSEVVLLKDVPDTAEYFSAMDIYVSTAREDPFPVVVLEAMASGIPVAGFAVGGIPEAVTPECGVLVKENDVESLARELLTLIKGPERRARLGRAARLRVEEHFTLSRYAAEMTKLIETALR